MVTFHPAARKVSNGFLPSVMVRAEQGRMVGSKVSQVGNVFATAEEAKAFAMQAALRVVASYPDTMRVCAA